MVRRIGRLALCLLAPTLVITTDVAADDSKEVWAALAKGGHVALIRHGNAPPGYGGDPPGFKLHDWATQRTLVGRGRAKAKARCEGFSKPRLREGLAVPPPVAL